MRVASLILLAGCHQSAPTPQAVGNKAADAAALVMTEHGVGPIVSTTKATLTDLRALFVGYEVKPTDDDDSHYDVYGNGKQLLYIVLDEDSDLVLNVQAVSPQVEVSGHSWRVGDVFHDAAQLSDCECWGSNPTCFALHQHIAVNFAVTCDESVGGHDRMLRMLDGRPIRRVIWTATAFGEPGSEDRD